MPFVCLSCGVESEGDEDFGCAVCGGFIQESQTQEQDLLDSAEQQHANARDFKTLRSKSFQDETRQDANKLKPCKERSLNWELYLKCNYRLKNQQDIFQQMLVAAAICFSCNLEMVLEHGKQLWFQFLESIQVDESPGQALGNEEIMALQFSHLNGLVEDVTDRIVRKYTRGPFEQFFKSREKSQWVKLALQKHEQLLQERLKYIEDATSGSKILGPDFDRLSFVQRAEILRQEVRRRTHARLRPEKPPILHDLDGQVVPHDVLEKEKEEFYQRLSLAGVVADAQDSWSADSSEEERVAEPEEVEPPVVSKKKKAKGIAEQVVSKKKKAKGIAEQVVSKKKKAKGIAEQVVSKKKKAKGIAEQVVSKKKKAKGIAEQVLLASSDSETKPNKVVSKKKKAKGIAEQVLLASSDSEETKPNKAASGSSDLKKKVAQLKDQKPNQMEDDPGANYHNAEDVTEQRRLFLAMIWMALSSSCQAVLLGDVILAVFQGPLKPWIEKYEHLEFLKRSMRLPPLNQDTLYEQLKARSGRMIRCRYRFHSQHPEMFLHRFAGLLEDESSVIDLARMCCRSRHLAGYWQRMIISIEKKVVSDKYKEGTEWCPASKAFFCVLAGLRLQKMKVDEEIKVQEMLDKESCAKVRKTSEKDQKDPKDHKEGKSDGEDGKRCSAKGLKNIPAVYEKKVVRKEQSKRQFPDRRQVITRVPRKLQRERSRSRGAGRDDAKDSKKGQKEQSDENQGKGKKEEKQKEEPEDEHTRYVKDMTRLVRLALELTETLMGKKCRDTALHFTLHADLLATEIYRGTGRKRPQILQEPLLAALNAVKS